MKKFYFKSILFFCLLGMLLLWLDRLSMSGDSRQLLAEWTDSESYITGNTGADEIKPVIWNVQIEDGTTALILGDSVCHQMFSDLWQVNENITIAGSNGAITMAGQYILAKEYLDHHPEATDIYLLALPGSLCRSFDTELGYQYVVMPFVETGTLYDLDTDSIDLLKDIYGKWFVKKKVVTAIDNSGINRKLYLNLLQKYGNGYALKNYFEFADKYIGMIQDLCEERDVELHFMACPVAESHREQMEALEAEYETSELYKDYPDYLRDICYYPTERAADETHFSGDYANQDSYNEMIREAYAGTKLLDILTLE